MKQAVLRFQDPREVLARMPRVRARRDEVHVWPLLLEGADDALARCASLLSSDETERARRFFHERNRREFVFAHGLMRHVLSQYCATDPAALEFDTGEFGKPRLTGADVVSFNLSHSHGRALLAVSVVDREVGVDIEQESARTDVLGIASSYFCASELVAIQSAVTERRTEVFFSYWAAKEAVLKAAGTGLHVPLDTFEICFAAGQPRGWMKSFDEARFPGHWTLQVLDAGPTWHGAVASAGSDWAALPFDA